MDKEEYKKLSIETLSKSEKNEKGEMQIEGYASIFGNTDCYDDVVERGAFGKSLQDDGERVVLCFNHDTNKVIGRIDELKEDEKGLYFKATILPTELGKDVMVLIEGKALTDLSFMYRVVKYDMDESDANRPIRHIKEAKLYEISVVWRGANDRAKIEDFARKSFIEDLHLSIKNMTDEELERHERELKEEIATRIINKLIN